MILYEDNHLLVLNKPCGWLVQGDRTGDPTLTDWGKSWLAARYNKPGLVFLHPVHRIDRPVSGALMLARTSKALTRLNAMFKAHQVQKTYFALVTAPPRHPEEHLTHWLHKDAARNRTTAFDTRSNAPNDAREANLTYRLIGACASAFLLLVHPHTGRPHQIRAQLGAIGCPILGDLKYGASYPLPDASIGLHSRSLAFEHPVRQEHMSVVAPTPDQHWWAPVDKLGFDV